MRLASRSAEHPSKALQINSERAPLSAAFFGLVGHSLYSGGLKNDVGRPAEQQHAVHRRDWPEKIPTLNRRHVPV
jgi:hypothetical protein